MGRTNKNCNNQLLSNGHTHIEDDIKNASPVFYFTFSLTVAFFKLFILKCYKKCLAKGSQDVNKTVHT